MANTTEDVELPKSRMSLHKRRLDSCGCQGQSEVVSGKKALRNVQYTAKA